MIISRMIKFNVVHHMCNNIYADYQNDFVRVEIETDPPQISCTFLNTINNADKSCNVVITYGRNCELNQTLYGEEAVDRPDVVIVSLRNFPEPSRYCQLNVNTRTDTKNIILFGTSIGKSISNCIRKKNNTFSLQPCSQLKLITMLVPLLEVWFQ